MSQSLRAALDTLIAPDSLIVAGYFLLVFVAGAIVARRFAHRTTSDFITGGRTFTWKQTGTDAARIRRRPDIHGPWPAWFFVGMYLSAVDRRPHLVYELDRRNVPRADLLRTRIVTTPEYLERRFDAKCRAMFSVLMAAILIIILTSAMYLGGLLITRMLGWPLWVSVAAIARRVYVLRRRGRIADRARAGRVPGGHFAGDVAGRRVADCVGDRRPRRAGGHQGSGRRGRPRREHGATAGSAARHEHVLRRAGHSALGNVRGAVVDRVQFRHGAAVAGQPDGARCSKEPALSGCAGQHRVFRHIRGRGGDAQVPPGSAARRGVHVGNAQPVFPSGPAGCSWPA